MPYISSNGTVGADKSSLRRVIEFFGSIWALILLFLKTITDPKAIESHASSVSAESVRFETRTTETKSLTETAQRDAFRRSVFYCYYYLYSHTHPTRLCFRNEHSPNATEVNPIAILPMAAVAVAAAAASSVDDLGPTFEACAI
jgi:hypothetical protein